MLRGQVNLLTWTNWHDTYVCNAAREKIDNELGTRLVDARVPLAWRLSHFDGKKQFDNRADSKAAGHQLNSGQMDGIGSGVGGSVLARSKMPECYLTMARRA